MKKYNKLVRDKIPEIIRASGEKPKTRILKSDKDYLEALINKLIEESKEVEENPSSEELADVLEVLLNIGRAIGLTYEDIETIRQAKEKSRGGFDKRIFLVSTE